MAKHVLKFYPVANGDTTLIKLSDETTLLLDCKIRSGSQDENENFDVKRDLLKELKKKNSCSFLDLFILSHPDQDHCLGFESNFYQGDPDKYSKENRMNDEIIMNEIWVTSSLFNDANSDDAKSFKKEAERRKKLWDSDSAEKSKDGNRIRMIGYDGDAKFSELPNSVPGDTLGLAEINGSNETFMEIFIHGPFKKSLIESQAIEDKNSTSIILQIRFKEISSDDWCAYFLTGGDADHYRWEQVLKKSQNNDNEDKLLWDVFQTPHHCSWSYFNDVPYTKEENRTPKNYSLEILDFGRKDSYVIASSRKIMDEEPNPPHAAAKKEFKKKVKIGHFLNTNVNHSEKRPIPIVFEVTSSGLTRIDQGNEKSVKLAAAAGLAGTSAGSGNWSI
jgi:hypothetical protein